MPKPDGTPDDTLDAQGNPITPVTPPAPQDPPANPDGNQQKGPVTYTEAQYKGLQAVIAKRDGTIGTLTTQITDLEAKLADAQSKHGTAVTEKTTLGTQLTEAQKQVTALQGQVTALQKKVSFQEIIMKDYADLASVASFIPDVATPEEFRQKATELRASLSSYVKTGVQGVLDGSTPPVTKTEGTTLGVDEEEKAYREVTSLAGRPGKEKEYQAAYDKYQAILAAKQPKTT